ncbi:unnamed protein product [Closterium sp. NIES-53]
MPPHSKLSPCNRLSSTTKHLGSSKTPFFLLILVTLHAASPVRPAEAVKNAVYRHADVPDALLRLQQDARSLIELHESYYQPQQVRQQSSGNAYHQQQHGVGRHLLQSVLSPDGSTVVNATGSVLANATILLATDRARRINPINEFKYYIGGWNLSSDDYWASVTFSVVYAPVIGFAWLLLGVGFVLFLVSLFLFCRARWDEMRDPAAHVYSPQNISLLLYALVVGAMIVITGFGLMIAGSVQLNDRLGEIGDYTIKVTNATTTAVYNVASAIQVTAGTRINEQLLQPEQRLQIFEFSKRVTSAALELNDKITNSDSELRDFGKKMSTTVFVVGCIAFAFVVLTVVAAILQWATFSHVMCTLVWITAFVTWCIVAVFLTVVTVSADTESAVKEVTLYPSLNTAFSRWVPCLNATKLGDAARFARFAAYDVITFTNANLQTTYPKLFTRLNATAGICSPFGPGPDYLYNDTACSPNSITFRQLKDLLPEVTCPDAGCPRGKDGKPPLDMLPAAVARDVRMAWISVDRLDGSVPLVAALSNCSHVSSVAKREGVSSGWQCHSGSGRVVPYTGGSAASFPPSPTARTSPASPSAVWTAAVALVTALAHNEGRASVPTMSCCGAMVLAVGGMVLAFIWVVMLTQLIFFLYSSSLVRPHPPVCRRGSSRGTERVSAAVDGSHGAGCGSNGGGCGGSPLRLPCHALPARWWQGRQQVRGLRGKGGWDGAVCELSSVPCAACPMGARVPTGHRRRVFLNFILSITSSIMLFFVPDPISLAVSSATGLAVFVGLFTSYLNPWDEDDDAQQHWHFPPKESAEARRVRWARHIRQRLKTLVPLEERVQGKAPCTAEQLIREIRSARKGNRGCEPRLAATAAAAAAAAEAGERELVRLALVQLLVESGPPPALCAIPETEDGTEEADDWGEAEEAEYNSGVRSALLRRNRGCAQRGPAEEFVAVVAEMEGADPVFALGPRYATRRVVREALALLSEGAAVAPSDG